MNRQYKEIVDFNSCISLDEIPVLDYDVFSNLTLQLLEDESKHCLLYFAYPAGEGFVFICCIGDDGNKKILAYSHKIAKKTSLKALSEKCYQLHIFEREIYENYGIEFIGHPWLKPVRYPYNRSEKNNNFKNYPFYEIKSDELHEVGVGPVHAGIIEPGYFRFICNGENVIHLEIQLGYQHRGVEELLVKKIHPLQKILLAEGIAGDTTIGHSVSCASVLESLAGVSVSERLQIERTIALELERIAIHIGDTAALCTDIAYQFGQVVNEALRTVVINTMLHWCGNRFGKGLIRPFGSYHPLNKEICSLILNNLANVEKRYKNITERIFTLPSILARFERTGKVSTAQASLVGAVGMAARSSGLKRDARWSHPSYIYRLLEYEPVVIAKGDVWARALLRKLEVEKSISIVKDLISKLDDENGDFRPGYNKSYLPASLSISVTEGWRGEICHAAITDDKGKIIHYKVKDPSFHNWMALALAVRGQEISDFPLCNKSYNLSYCGNDL